MGNKRFIQYDGWVSTFSFSAFTVESQDEEEHHQNCYTFFKCHRRSYEVSKPTVSPVLSSGITQILSYSHFLMRDIGSGVWRLVRLEFKGEKAWLHLLQQNFGVQMKYDRSRVEYLCSRIGVWAFVFHYIPLHSASTPVLLHSYSNLLRFYSSDTPGVSPFLPWLVPMLIIHNPAQRILQRIRWDPSVGIRLNLSVGFDRLLPLISSFKRLVPRANFRDRSVHNPEFNRIFWPGKIRALSSTESDTSSRYASFWMV